ncbi:MAG: MIP/aquaporin family protein [Ktedonobacterales bacterium]
MSTRHIPTSAERFAAEAVGTFVLVFIGSGAGALTALLPHNGHFPKTAAELLLLALAFGFALFVVVMLFGRISGAHVNPAVTIGLAATGNFAWGDVLPYIVAQLLGAILGALGIAIVYGKLGSTVGHLGAPSLSTNTSILQGIVAEAIGAAILMLAVFAMAVDKRAPAGWAGLVIGLALGAAIMVVGPASGGSLNPARAFGPDLVNIFFGTPVNWGDFVLCYTVGPILGMIGAAFLYRYVANVARPEQSTMRSTPGRSSLGGRAGPRPTVDQPPEPGEGATT